MEMRRYAEIVERRKWVVLATMLAVLAVVAIGTRMMAPVYSTSALVRISEVRTGPVSFSDTAYSQTLQNTFVQLLQSRASLDTVNQQLDLKLPPQTLAGMVKVEAVPNTELIKVTASSSNPRQAADIAEAISALLVNSPPSSYTVTMAEDAAVPTTPVRPQPLLYLELAALVGLIAGLGLAFLFDGMDRTIHSGEEFEGRERTPILGWIPRVGLKGNQRGQAALMDHASAAPAVEAYRILSANTLARLAAPFDLNSARQVTLLVASPEARTGKSTVLVNLAAAMAREGHRVTVVGSNLLHPDLARTLGVSDKAPKGEVLRDPRDVEGRLLNTGIPGIKLLPSSAISAGSDLPPALWMRELVETLARGADVVLLDSPPVLASADAAILAPLADGILLVAARNQTTSRYLDLAQAQLEAVGGKVLGVVLNRAKLSGRGNLYVGPVGGVGQTAAPATRYTSVAVRDPLTQVMGPEIKNGSRRGAHDHDDKLEKAG